MTHDEMIAVIQAHQRGKKIQRRNLFGHDWHDTDNPMWSFDAFEYRVKPEMKSDVIRYARAEMSLGRASLEGDNLRLTFDGETGKLKAAEVL